MLKRIVVLSCSGAPRAGRRTTWAVGVALLWCVSCTSLPDPGPFVVATAELDEAVRASGRAVTDEFGRMTNGPGLVQEFTKAWKAREAVLRAMVAYADSLRSIVAAAGQAGESGKQLAEKVGNLATAAGIVDPAAGASVKVAAELAGRVWQEIAMARAASSLVQALDAVQPAIETIADTMAADTKDLHDAVAAALGNQLGQIKGEPGYNDIVGFHLHAPIAKAAVLSEDLDPGSLTWGGRFRLEALERQLASTREDYERFQSLQVAALERSKRASALVQATGDAVARWGSAHRSLVEAMRARKPITLDSLLDAVEDVRQLIKKVRDP